MARLEIVNRGFFFNLDADVGKASSNLIDDVELVRYGYFCVRVNSKLTGLIKPDFRSALDSMQLRGPYANDLQKVIDVHQAMRGGTQDGKVSVGKPQVTHDFKYDSKFSWIIFSLCMSMIDRIPDIYPRIDNDEASGPEISKRVRQLFRIE